MKFPKVSDLKDEKDAKVRSLGELYEAASKRDASGKLNEEEAKRFKEIDAEIRNLDTQIELSTRAAEHLKSAEGGEDKGYDNRGQNPKITGVKDLEAERGFKSLGEQLRAIQNAGTPGNEVDKRLLHINEVAERATGASAAVGSDGGFFIGATHAKQILSNTFETGKLPSLISELPLEPGTDRLIINTIDETSRVSGSHFGGIVGYWKGEGQAYVASRPKFGELELKLKKLTGLYYATDELQRNAPAQEALVMMGFSSVFGFMLDDAIMNGTGANKPKGFLNSAAVVTVSKESGQAADTVKVANLAKMEARLPDNSEDSAIWMAHKSIKPQILELQIGNYPMYLPQGSLASGVSYATLLGRRILFSEHCQVLGDKNDLILVDPKQLLAIRQGGMEVASSIHVQFLYGEQMFRITTFYDCQPVMNKAITPKNGTDTMSPYINLEAR